MFAADDALGLTHLNVSGGQPSSSCKFVLVGLANHAAPDGAGAFPSVTTLVRYSRHRCITGAWRRAAGRAGETTDVDRRGSGPPPPPTVPPGLRFEAHKIEANYT
ncbi:MAG: hypothetical protein J2P30_08990 [Actinobacteria bacterium]|nr:hypothetical protein [Actinomycetota bacterium]